MNGHLAMKTPPIVSPQEWEAARQKLLVKEKEVTRGESPRRSRDQRIHRNPVTLVTPTLRRLAAKLSHDQQRAIGSERYRVPAR